MRLITGALCVCLSAAHIALPSSDLPGRQPAEPQASVDKEQRTPAQQKVNSQILDAIQRRTGNLTGLPLEPPRLDIDKRGQILIDIRANVTTSLLAQVRKLGGTVISTSAEYRSIIARLPLEKVETLAGNAAVLFIEPAAEATTNRKK